MAIIKRNPKTGKSNHSSFFIMPVPYDINTAAIGDMLIKEGYEINKNLFLTNQGYDAQLKNVAPIGDIIEDQLDKYDDAVDIYAIEMGIESISSFVHDNFMPGYTPNSKVHIIAAQTDGETGPELTGNIGYIDVTKEYFNDSSLKTVAEKIGHKLTNEEEFIAAYDTAGIRGIQELAHSKRMSERQANKIVSQIVAADERLQGITEEEIWEAMRGVDNMEVVEDVALIAVNHDKCLPVINELETRFGMYGNVFIMCGTEEVDFYGDNKACHALKEKYGGWIGDTKGKISFWGHDSNTIDKTECIEFIIKNMRENEVKGDKTETEVNKTQTKKETSEKVEITDVTLLTKEEAKALPEDQRKIGSLWWLRSPGDNRLDAAIVHYDGALGYDVFYYDNGVRPALKISNLASANLSIGDSFEKAGQKWTIINEDTALCDNIVGRAIFDEKNNDYEKSDIKKWLKNWARERGLIGRPVSIPIDEEHFPDENFRKFLLEQPYGKNGKLSPREIKGITEINCEYKKISDLTGIEFFTELKSLRCGNNYLKSLNISNNPELETLHCGYNNLESLDISNNPELRYLNCKYNLLEVLDISNWKRAELASQVSTIVPCYYSRRHNREFADLTGQPEGFVLIRGIDTQLYKKAILRSTQPEEKITILKSMLPRVKFIQRDGHGNSYIIYKTNKEELLNFLNAHPENAELVTELKRYCKKELIKEAQDIYKAPSSETKLSQEGYSAVGEVVDELETTIKGLAKIQKRNEILNCIESISLPTKEELSKGYMNDTTHVSEGVVAYNVHPVLKISEPIMPAGEYFTIAGHEWQAINKDTLICNDTICRCCYERGGGRYFEGEGGYEPIHEGFDIKNWLETWAAERGLIKGVAKEKDEPSKEEEPKKDELTIIEPKTREIRRKR